jgi:hypothetical protein
MGDRRADLALPASEAEIDFDSSGCGVRNGPECWSTSTGLAGPIVSRTHSGLQRRR